MYTLLLGHEVSADEPQEGLQSKVLPASRYVVFRTEQGAMPQVVIEAWQKIWAWMEHTTDIRTYTGDYEVYDAKYSPNDAIVEIYIAIA
ncbi:Bacterial transcription activator, effector binding domain [compost metagenome]